MNTEIPFSPSPPTEPGAYFVKSGYGIQCLVIVRESGGELIISFDNEQFMEMRDFGDFLWSPRLIPETELLSAKKRIEELEWRLKQWETGGIKHLT